MPRSVISGSCDHFVQRSCQMFVRRALLLYVPEQKNPVSPHRHQHLVLSPENKSHSGRCEVGGLSWSNVELSRVFSPPAHPLQSNPPRTFAQHQRGCFYTIGFRGFFTCLRQSFAGLMVGKHLFSVFTFSCHPMNKVFHRAR